jgi:hypothetical protein
MFKKHWVFLSGIYSTLSVGHKKGRKKGRKKGTKRANVNNPIGPEGSHEQYLDHKAEDIYISAKILGIFLEGREQSNDDR